MMTDYVHVSWLIGLSIALGIVFCVLLIFIKINRDFIEKDIEETGRQFLVERRFHLLGRMFKAYILSKKETSIFIPECFLVQSDDYDFNCSETKDGIDVDLIERENDRK